MANPEESSPLVGKQSVIENEKKSTEPTAAPPPAGTMSPPPIPPPQAAASGAFYGWTADGLPLGYGSVDVVEPLHRQPWDSGLSDCLGRDDEFFSSDLEICVLGTVAPCVLFGSNAERLRSALGEDFALLQPQEWSQDRGTFTNHCQEYAHVCFPAHYFFCCTNCCEGCMISCPHRVAIRQEFNLEGSCEALTKSFGCCGSFMEDEVKRERCESACDCATHMFCHACALCQEGREIRHRIPHPAGLKARPILVTIPPTEQTMGRGGA